MPSQFQKMNPQTHRMQCRQQEYNYIEQIFNQYVKGHNTKLFERMFQTLHSDFLNLKPTSKQHPQNIPQKSPIAYNQVIESQTEYQTGDIILEIRGSIINKQKLKKLIKQKPQFSPKVNCLLFGTHRNQVLIPKGLSKTLLSTDPLNMNFIRSNQDKSNCIIELEYGSKYLVSASMQINSGDPLILNFKSLQRNLFTPFQNTPLSSFQN